MALSKANIEDCVKNIEDIKKEFILLNNGWFEDASKHNDMILYDKVLNFRRNIHIVLDQLFNFVNLSSQIHDLDQFHKDPACFDFIQTQIQWLVELRDSIEEKISSDASTDTKEARKLLAPFDELEAFQIKFYDHIFNIVTNALDIAKQNPKLLIRALYIIKNADVVHKSQNSNYYYDQCKETIRISIENRFLLMIFAL